MTRALSSSTHLNIHGLGKFLTRISTDIEAMRSKMFDHDRLHRERGGFDAARLARLEHARTHMYAAWKALIAAQAELIK